MNVIKIDKRGDVVTCKIIPVKEFQSHSRERLTAVTLEEGEGLQEG